MIDSGVMGSIEIKLITLIVKLHEISYRMISINSLLVISTADYPVGQPVDKMISIRTNPLDFYPY